MTRIAIAQINPIAGDIEYNFKKIEENVLKAKDKNAHLIIFPEFALSGYPFGDIFARHSHLFEMQKNYIDKIKKLSANIVLIAGFLNEDFESDFMVFQNKKSLDKIFKIEDENFCTVSGLDEDIIKENNVKYYINCINCPSRVGIENNKDKTYSNFAKENKVNMIYVNQTGYGDNFVFDGASRIYDENGNLTLRLKAFEEDFAITDNLKGQIFDVPKSKEFMNFSIKNYEDDMERTLSSIVYSIKEYFSKNGFEKAVLGMSGGLDSTISAFLLTLALGKDNVIGISMPSSITLNSSKSDAQILAQNLGIKFIEYSIKDIFNFSSDTLNSLFKEIKFKKQKNSTTFENLQARLRATILWSISNEYEKCLPIATSDKSEFYIGYATVNGDMSGGFAPIADVCKTKLFALGDYINKKYNNIIPESILSKRPGAELKLDEYGNPVCAEDENMPYHFLDEIIFYVENYSYSKDELLKHEFEYEKEHKISFKQKKEWIIKFYKKMHFATYKWHLSPPTVLVDYSSINNNEYHQPILSRI